MEIDFIGRARKGAALLDEFHGADWDEMLDLDALDVSDCMFCVLGQLFGDYNDGLDRLLQVVDDRNKLDAEYGFSMTQEEFNTLSAGMESLKSEEVYAPLTQAWREVLTERRNKIKKEN